MGNKTLSTQNSQKDLTEIKKIPCPVCKKEVSEHEHGYSLDYYNCCNICRKTKDVLESYPFVFKNASFENYTVNNRNSKAYNFLKDFKVKDETGAIAHKGAFITGKTGIGKTHLLYAFMRKNLIHNKYFFNYIELLNDLKKELFENTSHKTPFLENVCESNILIIDDFGNGKVTEWAVEQVNHIINQRYIHGKLTFITTNLPLDGDNSVESNFGARVSSRLYAMTSLFFIDDKDHRI